MATPSGIIQSVRDQLNESTPGFFSDSELYSYLTQAELAFANAIQCTDKTSATKAYTEKWTEYNTLEAFGTDIVYANNMYTICDISGNIFISQDGITLNKVFTATDRLDAICFGNGLYVTVGVAGICYTSTDCINWTFVDLGINVELEDVQYINGNYVIVGNDGMVQMSPDGIIWTWKGVPASDKLYGVTYAQGYYVVVGGNRNESETDRAYIGRSIDGNSWDYYELVGNYRLKGIAYGNGVFIATGHNGVILYTTDITKPWKQLTVSINSSLMIVVYANDRFMLVGSNGVIYSSVDGLNWYSQNSGTTKRLEYIIFNSTTNEYIIVGDVTLKATYYNDPNWPYANGIVREYNKPTDCLNLYRLTWDNYPLIKISENDVDMIEGTSHGKIPSRGTPLYYYEKPNAIGLSPAADEEKYLQFYYYKYPTALSSTSIDFTIPNRFAQYLVDYVMYRAFLKDQDARATGFLQLWNANLKTARTEYKKAVRTNKVTTVKDSSEIYTRTL